MKEARCSLANVMRVRPGTSKGITDLLLPQTPVRFDADCASKKILLPKLRKKKGEEREETQSSLIFFFEPQMLGIKLFRRVEVSFVIGINQTNRSTN